MPGYDPLQRLLEVFAGVQTTATAKEDRSGWPVDERLKHRIIDGDRDGLDRDLDEALAAGTPALSIVNDVLLDGMKVVGDLFGSGEMQLPFVLQSAETMKAAVAHLEPHMERSGGSTSKGRIVLATVKGDVHDIGKNLVDIILTNNGYEVYNLGIKCPIGDMVATAEEIKADAIGMSGLLVKSTLIMRDNLEELNGNGLSHYPGAARRRRARHGRTSSATCARSTTAGCSTGRTRSKASARWSASWRSSARGADDPDFGRVPTGPSAAGSPRSRGRRARAAHVPRRRRKSATDNEVFVPPFLGARVVKGIALDDIAAYVNETALFRNQWQFRPESRRERRRVQGAHPSDAAHAARGGQDDRRAGAPGRLRLLRRERRRQRPRSSGRTATGRSSRRASRSRASTSSRTSASPTSSAPSSRASSTTPRSTSSRWARQCRTRRPELFAENRYQDYLLLHGLGVEMAEALAEMWHRRIREEWGFADEDGPTLTGLFRQQYRGGRYSWGYPACPDLEDNAKVAELLGGGRDRRGGQRRDLVAVPPGADDLRDHLPPPPGEVLRRPRLSGSDQAAVSCSRAAARASWRIRRASATPLRPTARVESSSRHCSSSRVSIKASCRAMRPVCGGV